MSLGCDSQKSLNVGVQAGDASAVRGVGTHPAARGSRGYLALQTPQGALMNCAPIFASTNPPIHARHLFPRLTICFGIASRVKMAAIAQSASTARLSGSTNTPRCAHDPCPSHMTYFAIVMWPAHVLWIVVHNDSLCHHLSAGGGGAARAGLYTFI